MNICKEVSKSLNPDIDRQSDNETMFYINYAGGDDLVIMGPVAGIIQLADEINIRFNQYTLNKNISISGGITIQSPSVPIRFGIHEAEEYLSASKQLEGKNGITLIQTSCKMEEYHQMLKKVNEYRDYIKKGYISRTNFYNIMTILDTDQKNIYLKNVPVLLYSLKRNVKNNDIRQKLISDISSPKITMHELRKLVLEMKLAIMQTREAKS